MRVLKWKVSSAPDRQHLAPNIGFIDPLVREFEVPEPTAPIIYTLTLYNAIGETTSKQYRLLPKT